MMDEKTEENKMRYQRTFSKLSTSRDYVSEVYHMNKTKKMHISKIAVAVITAILIVGVSTVSYAANIGGIQRKVQLWIEGDRTDATLDIRDDGSYLVNYIDEEGKTQSLVNGGAAIEDDGSERSFTEQEILEQFSRPEIRYLENGKVIVYYYDKAIDITDLFENGVCYVTLLGGDKPLYLTILYQAEFAYSPIKYMNPEELTIE